MERNNRIIFLLLSITIFSVLGWFINSYSPGGILPIIFFLGIICSAMGFLFFYVLKNVQRALLYTGGCFVFFLLRAIGLKHIVYSILLIITVVSIDYLVFISHTHRFKS